MSTSNFMSECGKYFAIDLEQLAGEEVIQRLKDEEELDEKGIEKYIEDEPDRFNEEVYEVSEWMYDDIKENLRSEIKEKFKSVYETYQWDYERNFVGRIISVIERRFKEGYYKINVIIRSGYYSGINLDYTFEYCCEEAEEKYGKSLYRDLTKLEKIFEKYSDEYILVGCFSNGEAVYKLREGGKK